MESTRHPAKSKLRDVLLLVGLFVAGAAAVAGYSYFTRTPAGVAAQRDTRSFRTALASTPDTEAMRSPRPAFFAQAGSTPQHGEASDSKAEERAAAIEALGRAAPVKAIPVLQKVINTSADEPEWRAALRALSDIATTQGDPDETIRNGLREAISHTSNEALMLGAQEAVDRIDRATFEAATGRPATPDAMRGAPETDPAESVFTETLPTETIPTQSVLTESTPPTE